MFSDEFLLAARLLPTFVYPLGFACLLLLIALTLGRRPWLRSATLWLALLTLWLPGTWPVASALGRPLEWRFRSPDPLPSADAIVVLGGGTAPAIPPRPWIDLRDASDRLLYAARLHRELKAPIVVASGGGVPWANGEEGAEAPDMRAVLELFGVPAAAIVEEPRSRNTLENAVETRRLLDERGARRILLVTSALHMPRAVLAFRHVGFEVVPAPTDYWVTEPVGADRDWRRRVVSWLPDAQSLGYASQALKEWIGLFVYRLQGVVPAAESKLVLDGGPR